MRRVSWVFVVAAAFTATEAMGVTINVDFQPNINDTSVAVNTYTVDNSGTAAAPDSGTVWNSLLANNPAPAVFIGPPGYYDEVGGAVSNYSNLLDSNGNATPYGISFDAAGSFAVENSAPNMSNIATDAPALMRDYLIAFRDGGLGGPRTVTLTGLPAGQQVELYLYGEGDNLSNDRQTSFDANGVLGATSGDAPANSPLALGSDYVVLSNVFANANGEVVIKYAANNVPEGPFNGFQMRLVPEPGTLALVSLAGLGLLTMRRKS